MKVKSFHVSSTSSSLTTTSYLSIALVLLIITSTTISSLAATSGSTEDAIRRDKVVVKSGADFEEYQDVVGNGHPSKAELIDALMAAMTDAGANVTNFYDNFTGDASISFQSANGHDNRSVDSGSGAVGNVTFNNQNKTSLSPEFSDAVDSLCCVCVVMSPEEGGVFQCVCHCPGDGIGGPTQPAPSHPWPAPTQYRPPPPPRYYPPPPSPYYPPTFPAPYPKPVSYPAPVAPPYLWPPYPVIGDAANTPEPTPQPTLVPSPAPTPIPSPEPTQLPTANPTPWPTPVPTQSPSRNPTLSPTLPPTVEPTVNPSETPTRNPTISPTVSPTRVPTQEPTDTPTKLPTLKPTRSPTPEPSPAPTRSPTSAPIPMPFCNICNAGFEGIVTDGGGILPTLDGKTISCATADIEGRANLFTAEECNFFRANNNVCGCQFDPCNVCGGTAEVTNMLATYGNENLIGGTGHCVAIQAVGEAGGYSPQVCRALAVDDLFVQTCGCSSTMRPTVLVTNEPSASPVKPPTGEPTGAPTPRPTPEPTPVPTRNPTPDPTPAPTLEACNICRDGGEVGFFAIDNIIAMPPPMMNVTCGEAQQMGRMNQLDRDQCLNAQALAAAQDRCECSPAFSSVVPPTLSPTPEPTPVPTLNPTPDPTPVPTLAPGSPFIPFCNICSNGGVVTQPNAFLNVSLTCGDADVLGSSGRLTADECVEAQLADISCRCIIPTPAPTPAPTATPTSPPPTPVPAPTMPPGIRPLCNICRDGGQITDFAATLATLGGISVTCFDAQTAGATKMLTLGQCATAQALAVGTCGCTGEVAPTQAPVQTGMPTSTPTQTPAPVAQPFCNVCGPFGRATLNAPIGSSQCFDVERMGMMGELDDLECVIAQIQVTSPEDPCRCSGVPTPIPTSRPTLFPTKNPTTQPTRSPSRAPTSAPTPRPSSSPTPQPTFMSPTPSPDRITTVPTSMPTDEPTIFCNICRDGGRIPLPNPTTIARAGDLFPITCEQADAAGRASLFTRSQCFSAQALAAGTCGCPFEPTAAPVPIIQGTFAPVLPTASPTLPRVSFPTCSVCLNGNRVSNLTGVIGSMTCQQVDVAATNGDLSPVVCAVYQNVALDPSDPCGCNIASSFPTNIPTSAAITTVPALPTSVPTSRPTSDPTPVPTLLPTPDPTPQPTTQSNSPASSLIMPTVAPTEVLRPICNICRDGGDPLAITKPFATLAQLNGNIITCQEGVFWGLQVGDRAGFTTDQCAVSQALAVNTCGCPGEPTPSPVSSPVPPSPSPTEALDALFCRLCLSDNDPSVNGFIAGMQCFDVAAMGEDSLFTQSECVAAQLLADTISDPCGCRTEDSTPSSSVAGRLDPTVEAEAPVSVIVPAIPTTPLPDMTVSSVHSPCTGLSVSFTIEVDHYVGSEFDFINVDRDGEALFDFNLMTNQMSMTLCITDTDTFDDMWEIRIRSKSISGEGAALIGNVEEFSVSLDGDMAEFTDLPQNFDITSSAVSAVSSITNFGDSSTGYGCTITFSTKGVSCALCGYNLSGPDATWLTLLDKGC